MTMSDLEGGPEPGQRDQEDGEFDDAHPVENLPGEGGEESGEDYDIQMEESTERKHSSPHKKSKKRNKRDRSSKHGRSHRKHRDHSSSRHLNPSKKPSREEIVYDEDDMFSTRDDNVEDIPREEKKKKSKPKTKPLETEDGELLEDGEIEDDGEEEDPIPPPRKHEKRRSFDGEDDDRNSEGQGSSEEDQRSRKHRKRRGQKEHKHDKVIMNL